MHEGLNLSSKFFYEIESPLNLEWVEYYFSNLIAQELFEDSHYKADSNSICLDIGAG